MPRITKELLRKRAEHNEGIIHTLEEISLHQEELESIELIGTLCRKLRILYLQNNIIEKIEGLHHLKELRYLNLALNNVKKIEGLSSCEFLEKLDLTVNFIDFDTLEESIDHLKPLRHLRELYLLGNPAQVNWEDGFNDFVIHSLPQLQSLDGKEITRTARIVAARRFEELQSYVRRRRDELLAAKQSEDKPRKERIGEEDDKVLSQLNDGSYDISPESESSTAQAQEKEDTVPHTPAARREMYMEMAEQKAEKERTERERLPKERDYEKEHVGRVAQEREKEANGEIRQCNEGKWDFSLDEDELPGCIVLEVDVPKFLDTSLVDVDLHPTYVSIVIKGKLLRLRHMEEVEVHSSRCLRVKGSGKLRLEMTKASKRPSVQPKQQQEGGTTQTRVPAKQWTRGREKRSTKTGDGNGRVRLLEKENKLGDEILASAVSIRGIVKSAERDKEDTFLLKERRTADPAGAVTSCEREALTSELDNPDVPPLE